MRTTQDENPKLLINAVKKSDFKEVGRLINNGKLEINTADHKGNSLLAIASGNGKDNFEIIDFLIRHNANVNAENHAGGSILAHTCQKNASPLIIKCLLEHKANIDQVDRDGMTPLMIAVCEGKSEAVKLLISARADLEAETKRVGNTVLLLACDKKNYEMVALLIQAGANVNHRQHSGEQCTALMIAAEKRENSVVSILTLLLQAGSDKTIQDRKGKKAQDIRRDKYNTACYIFLGLIAATLIGTGVYMITLPEASPVVIILGSLLSALSFMALIGVVVSAYDNSSRAIKCGYDWLKENSPVTYPENLTQSEREKLTKIQLIKGLNPIWSFKPKRSTQILQEYAEKITRGIKTTLETKESRVNFSIPEAKETQHFIEDQAGKYQEAITAALLDWDLFNDFTDDADSVTCKNQVNFVEKLTEKLLKLFYAQPLKFKSIEEIKSHVKDIIAEWSKDILHKKTVIYPIY